MGWADISLSTARFAAISPHLVRLICGPCLTCAPDSCLISLKNPTELWTAVQASDGRVYDALALHTWLQMKNEVIPTQPIDTVSINLWPSWCLNKTTVCAKAVVKCSMENVQKLAIKTMLMPYRRRKILRGDRETPKAHQRRPHMLLSVLSTYENKIKFRNARRIVASETSAFTAVGAAYS